MIDYTNRGEREASPTINGIKPDHVGRYKFATRHINGFIFDCACGAGYGSFIMAKNPKVKLIIALDKSPLAIEYAEKYYNDEKITYIDEDIFKSDMPDDYFDWIVSFETLEHLNDKKLIPIFHRILKRNGNLIVSTPNEEVDPFEKRRPRFHLKHYTPAEFEYLLTSNGFEIISKYTQYDWCKEQISEGWNGLVNIAIAKKK